MKATTRRSLLIRLVPIMVVGFLGMLGCAHQSPTAWVLPPLASAVRAQLGTIGVVWGEGDPNFQYNEPVKGAGAGARRGVGMAVKGWFDNLCCAGDAYGLMGVFLLGVTAVPLVGASVGAISAPSTPAVDEAVIALGQVQAELWTAEALQARVLAAAQGQTPYAFVGLQRPAAPTPGEPCPELQYQALSSDGVTTTLELWAPTLRLATEKTGPHINPDLHLTMGLRGRLVRTADNTVLYRHMAEYRSTEARTLVEWGANGAQAFRTEVEAGLRAVVTKIIDRMFLADAPGDAPTRDNAEP